jgi:hypothetical protein
MANKTIPQLTAVTSILDSAQFELDQSSASGSCTAVQLRSLANGVVVDDLAVDDFSGYAVGAVASLNAGSGWAGNTGVITGGTIVARTAVDGRAFQALQISNGQFGRRMPWGNKWSRLKLAVLWRLNGSASFNLTAADPLLGICSGTTNMGASATCANFIGLRWGSGAGDGVTFTAGTLINYYNMSTAFRFVTRRVNTTTLLGAGGSGHCLPATEGYHGALVYNIWRPVYLNAASSVTYTHMEISNAAAEVELSRQQNSIGRLMEATNTTAGSATDAEQGIVGTSVGTIAGLFDESTGVLDTLNFYWPFTNANAVLEISAVGIRKVA